MILSLERAKKVTEKIEEYAAERELNMVIAFCNGEGNPILAHVMDGAFLVSYELASSKAFSAVALNMPTDEITELAQPGGPLYGIDRVNSKPVTIVGGGVPIIVDGQTIGGLGISGGTAEEDVEVANYGLKILEEFL